MSASVCTPQKWQPRLFVTGAVSMILLFPALFPVAQESQPGSRSILRVYSEFEANRPEKKIPAKRPSLPRPPKITSPQVPNSVGITLWRILDSGSRKIERADTTSNGQLLKAERLSALSRLKPGEKVRLTIEVPREGYLYIVSREEYADGTLGDPYLVFPSKQILGGDNHVAPGQLTGIPAITDDPPYFNLERSGPAQVAELISFLILPEPIPNLVVTRDPIELDQKLFTGWQRWEAPVQKLELPATGNQLYTQAEQAAESKVVSRRLRHGDPLPQNLLLTDSKSESVMVTISLKFIK